MSSALRVNEGLGRVSFRLRRDTSLGFAKRQATSRDQCAHARPSAGFEFQLEAELRFHLDQLIEKNISSGMSPKEARRAA
jgi:hypothetical protein